MLRLALVLLLLPGLALAQDGEQDEASGLAGRRGHGLSVFSGGERTRFDVEILGPLVKQGGPTDALLARLGGAPLERTGVLQGMSGSPVYVDGRLIGAVAATWPFATEPLALIRPIDQMRGLRDFLYRGGHPSWRPGDPRAPAPAAVGTAPSAGSPEALRRMLGLDDATPTPGPDPLWPLPTADALSWTAQGLGPVVLRALEERLGVPVAPVPAGGGGEAGAAEDPRLAAGDPVAVLLVDGAARLGATGTVTEVDGDDVLAFGHPLLDAGPVSLPLCRAEIVGLMPSRQISFKFANPGAEVGALLLDRPAGIAGRLGVEADMLPLRVEVEDGLVGPRRFDFRVARHPGLSPALSYWCVQNALALDHDLTAPLTARVEVELVLEGEAPLRSEGAVAGLEIGGDLAREIMLPLNLVALQPERELRVESMRVAVRLERGRETAALGRVRMAPAQPRPGEDLRIQAELLPWRGSPRWVELELPLPADLPDGRYAVRVSDGAQAFADEIGRAEERWAHPGLRVLREALALRRPPTTLVAVLYGPSRGAVVRGVEWEQLPGSVRSVLGRSRGAAAAGEVKAAPLARVELPLDVVLGGGEILPLRVGEESPPAPTPTRR